MQAMNLLNIYGKIHIAQEYLWVFLIQSIFYIIFNGKIMEYPMQAMFLIFRGSWEDEFVNFRSPRTQKELDVARRKHITDFS